MREKELKLRGMLLILFLEGILAPIWLTESQLLYLGIILIVVLTLIEGAIIVIQKVKSHKTKNIIVRILWYYILAFSINTVVILSVKEVISRIVITILFFILILLKIFIINMDSPE